MDTFSVLNRSLLGFLLIAGMFITSRLVGNAGGEIGENLARAVTLTVEFKVKESDPTEYEEVNIYLLNENYEEVAEFKSHDKSFTHSFPGLKPGHYLLFAVTGSGPQSRDASRPGAFQKELQIDLDGRAEEKFVTVEYEYFDLSSMFGTQVAKARLVDRNDRPVAAVKVRAILRIETAGWLEIARTQSNDNGWVEFTNLADEVRYEIIDDNGSALGEISSGEEVTWTIPPQVGQTAPDVGFIHLDSGEPRRLSDFKGKIVLVEFWASWCGPCQEPMEKMQHYAEANPHWGDQVELISLSIDDTSQAASNHLAKNGWNKSYNAWAGPGARDAEAPHTYMVRGIPMAYLIDQEGQVAARGHPMLLNTTELINGLLNKEVPASSTGSD